jgi:hypothetical protein
MKLVRKIKFKRAKEISLFKKLEASFIKVKDENCKNPNSVKSVSDISKLNFYLVLEYINLIDEKIDYDKIFPDNPIGKNTVIDFNNLVEEQEKLKSYIQKSQQKGPSYFKNIGILNEVMGCYMLATPHKHLKKIKNLDFKNKSNEDFIMVKFDLKKLPFEFEKICLGYAKNQSSFLKKEKEEFQNFINLSTEEQDNILDEMMGNIQSPYLDFDISKQVSSATTIQFAAENSINQIYNIDFLLSMLASAEESENYELCIKIRDRICELKK